MGGKKGSLVNKSTKLFILNIAIILAFGLLTACTANANPNNNDNDYLVNEARDFAMGTLVTQKVYGPNGEAAIDEAMAKIRELEEMLSFNADRGDVFNLNQNAGKEKVELNPITIELIQKALEISELSGGKFDITVGPLVRAWGIGTEDARVPSPEEIEQLLPLVNYRDIEIEGNTAFLKKPGQMIDLGGIAKGYAGDEVIKIYKKLGIKSAVVNLGGNVVTLGGKPDGSPWVVGIMSPRKEEDSEQHLGAIMVKDKAVVTAGDGERYFIQDGVRYHHILDPDTGYPAKSDLMSVTLVTDSSFVADALDTAVFILGLEKGRKLIEDYGGVEAIFVTTDKKIYVTEGLKDNFTLIDKSYRLME